MPLNRVKLLLVSLLACGAAVTRVAPVFADQPTRLVRDDRRNDDDKPSKPPKPPKDPPGKNKKPTAKVQGSYVLKIAGYYTGSGDAVASGSGVSINGKVTDPADKEYKLSSGNLEVTNDRFHGTGTLGSANVEIDGRLDPKDDGKGNVLKRGRMTLTFRVLDAGNHLSRAAGEMKSSEK